MRFFILPKYLQNNTLKKTNLVRISSNFYMNQDVFFLFVSYPFIIKMEGKDYEDYEKKHFTDYTISATGEIKNIVPYIEKITSYEEAEIVFMMPNNWYYNMIIEMFLKYFKIDVYKKVPYSFLDFKRPYFDKTFGKEEIYNDDDRHIRIEILKNRLSGKIYFFFSQKTAVKGNIRLIDLMIDYKMRNKISRNIYKAIDGLTGKELLLYKDNGNGYKHYKNLYMFVDIENALFNINNSSTFKTFEYISSIEKSGEKGRFIPSRVAEHIENIKSSGFHLEEFVYELEDYFSSQQIVSKIKELYEECTFNNDNTISEYPSIGLNFDIFTYFNKLKQRINDPEFLAKELNSIRGKLNSVYKEKRKPICECAYCDEGFIYMNKDRILCTKCNFFLMNNKIEDQYGFRLKKLSITSLMRKRFTYEEVKKPKKETRCFYIMEYIFNDGRLGYGLKMVRKK